VDKKIVELIGGLFSIGFGFFLTFFYKIFTKMIAESQYKIFHFKYSGRDVIICKIFSVVIGIAFIIFGVSSLLDIIRAK